MRLPEVGVKSKPKTESFSKISAKSENTLEETVHLSEEVRNAAVRLSSPESHRATLHGMPY